MINPKTVRILNLFKNNQMILLFWPIPNLGVTLSQLRSSVAIREILDIRGIPEHQEIREDQLRTAISPSPTGSFLLWTEC